jgi:hypothetical protein
MTERLYTRDEAVELIKNTLGIPIRKSALEKNGPRIAKWYGRIALYTEPELLFWAQAFLSDDRNVPLPSDGAHEARRLREQRLHERLLREQHQ